MEKNLAHISAIHSKSPGEHYIAKHDDEFFNEFDEMN